MVCEMARAGGMPLSMTKRVMSSKPWQVFMFEEMKDRARRIFFTSRSNISSEAPTMPAQRTKRVRINYLTNMFV